MAFQTYEEFNTEVMRRYQAQDFQGTLDLLNQESSHFPAEAHQIHYLKACMTARLEQSDAAIALIQEAMESDGWYGEMLMRESPSFAPLQGMPQFERLVEMAKRKQVEAQGQTTMLILEPESGCDGDQRCSLVLALHGNGQNAAISLDAWRSVTRGGRLLVALKSGQAISGWQAVWDDVDASLQSVREHYAKLEEKYDIDSSKTIIGGFSMGGEIALRAALQGIIPAAGFLLLGPSMPSVDELESLLTADEHRDRHRLRGYILLGSEDQVVTKDAMQTVVDRLNAGGIPTHLELLPNVAHIYPPNFDDLIAQGIAFIEQQS